MAVKKLKERKKLVIFAISANEERWAAQWCESVLKANPDLVVFNLTQYDDNTELIVKSYIPEDKLIFIKHPWEKDFSKARNQALAHIPDTTNYAYFLDLDEIITEDSYSVLEDILWTDQEPAIVMWTILNTMTTDGMKASLFYPRMFPWKDATGTLTHPYFESSVHNQLILPGREDIIAVRPPLYIMHYGYSLSQEEMVKKHARSEELLRDQLDKDTDNFFAHLNLAQLLRARADHEGTIHHANEVLRIIAPMVARKEGKYIDAYLMAKEQITTALLAMGKNKEAIVEAEDVLKIKSDHLDSIMNLATGYFGLRELKEAEFWFKRYLFVRKNYDEQLDNTNIILNHLNSSFIALYHLGVIKAMQSNPKEAKEYFYKAYTDEPTFADSFIKYLHCLNTLGEHEKMADEANKYMTEYTDNQPLVYDYFGNLAIDNLNIEVAKFNYYQAAHSISTKDTTKYKDKWDSIRDVFGDIAPQFFDTSDKNMELTNKTRG